MWTGLTLSQPAPLPARLVRRVERLDHDALVPAGERVVEESLRRFRIVGLEARDDELGRQVRIERREPLALPERRSGRRRRDGGSRRRSADSGAVRARSALSVFVPKRLIVTWNGSGRPSSRSAIASPSSTSARHRRASARPRRSPGARSVMSARLRVKIRTSSPARCTWIRAPSSFHSTLARPIRSSALGDVVGGLGQHRRDRLQRREPEATEPVDAVAHRRRCHARKVACEHRRAAHGGVPARPRPSPRRRPSRLRARPVGALRGRAPRAGAARAPSPARESLELAPPRRLRARPGDRLQARHRRVDLEQLERRRRLLRRGSSRSAAHPTPTVPCGSVPDRYATAIATSSALASARQSASRATLPRRAGVAATSADACAISARSMADIQACHSHVRLIARA